mmetsp:Transcript_16/g.39  ORF Transcript_16/g.39 Transcript_16/m.39 type:complete len:225 (-) Transcript_16:29-703(-)
MVGVAANLSFFWAFAFLPVLAYPRFEICATFAADAGCLRRRSQGLWRHLTAMGLQRGSRGRRQVISSGLHLHPQNRPLLRPFCRLCLPFLFLCRNPSCPSCLLYPNLCRSRKNLYSNLSRQSSFSAPLQVHSRGQGLLSPSPSSTSRRRRQHKDPTPRSHLSLFLCRRPFLQTGPNPKHLSPNPSLPCRPCRRRCRPTTRCRRRRSRRQRAEGSAPRVAVEPLR